MDFQLKDRVVLITGGGSGIGRATACLAAQSGAAVGIVDMNAGAATETVEMVTQAGGRALALPLDVTDGDAIEAALDRLESEIGPVSGLVAAAGISRPMSAEEMTDEVWDSVIAVNLTGLFLSCQAAGRRMLAHGGGSIVTIGSVDSLGGHPGRLHYAASKHGVVGVTRVLALEWGRRGVRVNSVAPGAVDTPMLRQGVPADHIDHVLQDRTPMNRLGHGEDMARAALFLLSDAASYINGVLLPVDGGLSTGYIARWNGDDLASTRLLEQGVYGGETA